MRIFILLFFIFVPYYTGTIINSQMGLSLVTEDQGQTIFFCWLFGFMLWSIILTVLGSVVGQFRLLSGLFDWLFRG
jgi:hypothetical protein